MFVLMKIKLVVKYCNNLADLNLKLSAVDIRFTRRNYENIQLKAQVLTTMLANNKIHPRLAFEYCGMFVDSELAYIMSKEYYDSESESEQRALTEYLNAHRTEGLEPEGNTEPEDDEI